MWLSQTANHLVLSRIRRAARFDCCTEPFGLGIRFSGRREKYLLKVVDLALRLDTHMNNEIVLAIQFFVTKQWQTMELVVCISRKLRAGNRMATPLPVISTAASLLAIRQVVRQPPSTTVREKTCTQYNVDMEFMCCQHNCHSYSWWRRVCCPSNFIQ